MDTKGWTKQLPPDARDVLDAGLQVGPPAGAKQAVWSSLAAQLPAAATGGAAAVGGKSLLALLKPLAVGLAVGVVGAAGVVLGPGLLHTTPAPNSAARSSVGGTAEHHAAPATEREITVPRSAPAAASAVSAALPAPAGASLAGSGARPAPNTVSEPSEPRAPDPTRAEFAPSASVTAYPADAPSAAAPENAVLLESRRVAFVRSLLQQGNASGMLAELAELNRVFPRGVLMQERDILRIEALLALGQRDNARDAARRFVARYPDSLHVPAIERALR